MALQIGDEFYYSNDGDMLDVRIMTNYKTVYHAKVPIRDKVKLKKLLRELEQKGVNFGTNWFE